MDVLNEEVYKPFDIKYNIEILVTSKSLLLNRVPYQSMAQDYQSSTL